MSNYSAQELLAAGRYRAAAVAPYFRSIVLNLIPVEVPVSQLPDGRMMTMGVTGRGHLLVNWDFIAALGSADKVGFVLLHEVMHLALEHPKRLGRRDPARWNKAGDLALNPAILEMKDNTGRGVQPPTGPLAPITPDGFGFESGLTADEYYELLTKDEEQGGGGGGKQDQQGGVAQGHCGGCSGNPDPNEPQDGDDDGNGGTVPQGRSEAEMDRMRRQCAEQIADEARKGRGNVPGMLERWAEDVLGPPKVPWEQELAQVARQAIGWRPGAVDYRYDGPSRRQAGLGYGVGIPVLPRLRMPVPHVAIAVDTSGSMGTQELTDALRESDGILKAIGADVTYLACDADVHELKKVRNISDMRQALTGGGGTDFRPVFDALKNVRPLPEVLVFITDGCGPAPAVPPLATRVIWLLVGPYRQRPNFPNGEWGHFIEVDGSMEDAA